MARAEDWERLQARVEKRGYRLAVGRAARLRTGYLAGPDSSRLEDLQEALEDSTVAAVIPSRGGYGAMRLLRALSVPARRPPLFVGFSDITALHMRLASSGWVTFHGPMAAVDLGAPKPHRESVEWLWGMLEGRLRPPLGLDGFQVRTGSARGRLVGGNLTLLACMVGSGLLPSLSGGILLLEDVAEAPYRVDRMLTQLHLAGVLEGVAGLAVGDFSFPGSRERAELREGVLDVIGSFAASLGVPCVAGLPFGHERRNLAVPLGVEGALEGGRLVVVEDWLER